MSIRLRCRYCQRTAATVAETLPEAGVVEPRAVAVCAAHEDRGGRWCATAGPYRIRPLPGGWHQLSFDDPTAADTLDGPGRS